MHVFFPEGLVSAASADRLVPPKTPVASPATLFLSGEMPPVRGMADAVAAPSLRGIIIFGEEESVGFAFASRVANAARRLVGETVSIGGGSGG